MRKMLNYLISGVVRGLLLLAAVFRRVLKGGRHLSMTRLGVLPAVAWLLDARELLTLLLGGWPVLLNSSLAL